ncbi:alpha/beta fold hydrolase [Oceanobacillus senegalensis]|uniref:alpha/beta fold hydrolase n=1 Tax=Oceanobacillus senegalensis TaxID=1936063 RepID=UPI001FE29BBE|nr:alpha/beta hydrolase [Oceanobacillus senegalensis]
MLIHGFVSSTYTFNQLIPLLQKHFSVVAMDLPGFGRSEKSTSFVYSYQNYAMVVKKCLDYFELENVCIAGHSMGGQIALYTARLIPKRIRQLFLLCSSGYLKSANRLLVYSSYFPLFNLVVKRSVRNSSVQDRLRNVFYDHSYITEEHIKEFERPLKDKNFCKSLIRLLRHREGDLTSEELKKIKTPTLLIWGEDDMVVPLQVGKRLVNDLPNAELITYKKTGHLLTEERPMEITENILSYHLSEITAQ